MPAYHRQDPTHPRYKPLTALLERSAARYCGTCDTKRAGVNGYLSIYMTRRGFLCLLEYPKLAHEQHSAWEIYTPAPGGNSTPATIEALEQWLADPVPTGAPDFEAIGVLVYCADRLREGNGVVLSMLPPRFRKMGGEQFDLQRMLRSIYTSANPATLAAIDEGRTAMFDEAFVELLCEEVAA